MTRATTLDDLAARRRRQQAPGDAEVAAGTAPAQRAWRTVRRPITIGDVLRAFHELGATSDDERRAIARLLGYDLEGAAAGSVALPPIVPPAVTPRPVAKPEVAEAIAPADSDAPATELVRLPDIVTNPVDLPAPIARPKAAPPAAPHTAPLLAAEWSPAILARLGARMARLGAIDLARLIPRVARRAPIRSVPRQLRLVTAPRVAVVIDVSGVMPWLADDQAQLVAQLRATLRAPIEVVTSDGPPVVAEPGAARARGADDDDDEGDGEAAEHAELDAATGDDRRRGPRVRVEHGTRVLAITDLGAGSSWMAAAPGRVLAWRAFARDLRAQGASLVVLTPVPAARRPRELGELRCVHWDRRTRPSQVHALVRQLR